MTSVREPDDRGPNGGDGALFIADFYPRLGAHLARRHESGYDAVAGRARFLLWLAAHAEDGGASPDYLARVAALPRLTAEEETELATRVAAGRRAEEKLAEGGALTGEARADLERVGQDGALAGDRLLEANLWLVASLAPRYTGRGVLFADLIREGNVGLLRAVRKFDHTKGYRFTTYATWWVRQAMTRAVAGRTRVIPVPEQDLRSGDFDALTATERRMVQVLGREPTPEELAAELEVSPSVTSARPEQT